MEYPSKVLLITLTIKQGNGEEKYLFLKVYIVMAGIFLCTGINSSPQSKIQLYLLYQEILEVIASSGDEVT